MYIIMPTHEIILLETPLPCLFKQYVEEDREKQKKKNTSSSSAIQDKCTTYSYNIKIEILLFCLKWIE